MKKLSISIIAAAAMSSVPVVAQAQFGNLKVPGLPTADKGQGEKAPDVDTFLASADEADRLVRKAGDTLFQAVASKEELEAHEAKVKAANEVADPKEKEAALRKVSDDQQAALAKVDYNAKAKEASSKLDQKKKKQVGSAIWNFTLGMLKDKELVETGKAVISSISGNPMAATKLLRVKDAVSSISGQMGNITKIASGLQKMAPAVGVDKLPSKSSDQPVAVAD